MHQCDYREEKRLNLAIQMLEHAIEGAAVVYVENQILLRTERIGWASFVLTAMSITAITEQITLIDALHLDVIVLSSERQLLHQLYRLREWHQLCRERTSMNCYKTKHNHTIGGPMKDEHGSLVELFVVVLDSQQIGRILCPKTLNVQVLLGEDGVYDREGDTIWQWQRYLNCDLLM